MYDSSTNERPGVEESYQTAGNTSDLTVEADRRGAGDIMIAAGWSQSRLGMALLRLHSEWDAAARRHAPHAMPTVAEVAARMAPVALRVEQGADGKHRTIRGPNLKAAAAHIEQVRADAQRGRASDLRLLANSLKGRAAVWAQLSPWLAVKGISSDIGAEALLHWLHPSCPHCDGHGLKKVPNAPALSARQCHRCHGTGRRPHPHGSPKVLAVWLMYRRG